MSFIVYPDDVPLPIRVNIVVVLVAICGGVRQVRWFSRVGGAVGGDSLGVSVTVTVAAAMGVGVGPEREGLGMLM